MGQNEARLGIGLSNTNILYASKYCYDTATQLASPQVPPFAQLLGYDRADRSVTRPKGDDPLSIGHTSDQSLSEIAGAASNRNPWHLR
jgi:hypothetical protein